MAEERMKNRYSYEEPCGMEWVFIDRTGKDWFKHKGDTIVPGAGTRWKHLHRSPESAAAAAQGDQLEGLLAARFEFETKRRGCGRLAYPCVVASGANSVHLHYMHNNARLTPGHLLLMDAGGSYFGYSADITRTWPLSGTFTAEQRDIYEAVLGVNEQVIRAVRADGATSLQSLHQLSIRLMHDALVSLRILKPGEVHRVSRYYPHAIGHYLGLDVHDTPNASQSQARPPASPAIPAPPARTGAVFGTLAPLNWP
jgi:Xaa-Pro aminopeptidase